MLRLSDLARLCVLGSYLMVSETETTESAEDDGWNNGMGTPLPVYWRPSVINDKDLEGFKADLINGAEDISIEFNFIESADDLDILLESVRKMGRGDPSYAPGVITVIDAVSASKGAVMLVETTFYDYDVKRFTLPSADESRKFWSLAKEVAIIAANLEIGNMDWSEFAETAQSDPVGVYRGVDDDES